MPELPELQALAERLDAALVGASFARLAPLHFAAAKTAAPPPAALAGRRLDRMVRRGKYLVFEFAGPRLLVHLSQGGRVDVEDPPKKTRPRGGVARLLFESRPAVFVREYGTERKAGWWILAEGDDGPLATLGVDPFSDDFEATVVGGDDPRRVHTSLRDQRLVAGIGRAYADEILHRARLSPYVSLQKLSRAERRMLIDSTRAVLSEALEAERRRAGGLPAKLHRDLAVHGRHGEPCPRCGDALRRISYETYEVTYCPRCQTGGRILADRRLSRLVR